jgi:alpha-galactosidase
MNFRNHYHCNVSEDLIRATAAAIVSTGLQHAGYTYVVRIFPMPCFFDSIHCDPTTLRQNIDDCWQLGRYENGSVYPDPATFPNGMKALADYSRITSSLSSRLIS